MNMDGNQPASSQELNERIWLLESQLEQSERELDFLIYHLSHDLRAPLRGIDGYSQALLEDFGSQLEPMAKAYLEYIRDSSKRLSTLIDGLLRLSRIERAPLDIKTIDLSQIAKSIIDELIAAQPLREMSYRDEKQLEIVADADLMQVLMKCLLENAFKFTAKKAKAVIEFGAMEMSGRQVFLIRDNGAGFNMSDAAKLFIPFQRLHNQPEYEGPGLGLAIAQRIVGRHKGRIWAEGEPDNGATFYFSI